MKKWSLVVVSAALVLVGASCQKNTTPSPTPTAPTTTQSQGAALTVYKNTAYGFSFSYDPAAWKADEKINPSVDGALAKVKFISPALQKKLVQTGGYEMSSYNVAVSVADSVAQLAGDPAESRSLKDWLATQTITDVEPTTIAGDPAFKIMEGSIDAADIGLYIQHGGKIYVITESITADDDAQNEANNALVATFQFIK